MSVFCWYDTVYLFSSPQLFFQSLVEYHINILKYCALIILAYNCWFQLSWVIIHLQTSENGTLLLFEGQKQIYGTIFFTRVITLVIQIIRAFCHAGAIFFTRRPPGGQTRYLQSGTRLGTVGAQKVYCLQTIGMGITNTNFPPI